MDDGYNNQLATAPTVYYPLINDSSQQSISEQQNAGNEEAAIYDTKNV